MSVSLLITVADITATLGAGYTDIKVYRSAEEETGFSEITVPSNRIELEIGKSSYSFIDKNGTTGHWYRITYYDKNTPAETAFSSSFKGTYIDTHFPNGTYEAEAIYTSTDHLVLDKIRTLIGDRKELNRDYISPSLGDYSTISEDGYTHSLSNPRGWPVKITLDGSEYTSSSEPTVLDYQYITFSGTQISTISGTLDVWYYHFRYSDSEILNVYNALTPPVPLTEDQVTFELATLCAAIELLSSELRLSGVTSGTEVDIFEEIRINPKGGLDSRAKDLENLIKRKKELIEDILDNALHADIYGVRIE